MKSARARKAGREAGVEMSDLPKLKVTRWSLGCQEEETTYDFEQAKDLVLANGAWSLAFAEGEVINSYEELVQLAARDQYKDREVLNLTLLVPGVGGG